MRGRFLALVANLLLLAGVLSGCAPAGPVHFSGELAYRHVQAQVEVGPRIPGTEGWQRAGDYIVAELRRQGWEVVEERFSYAGTPVRNIIGVRGRGPAVFFGAHYDTRRYADRDPEPSRRKEPVPGANDGASGVAILLELARVLGKEDLELEVHLVFFDAEDQGEIAGWPWSVGAAHLAQALPPEEFPHYVVVVDMVGDAGQQLYWEASSDPTLKREIWALAAELGYRDVFTPTVRYNIIDDHRPFLQRGIPAVDVIDFDYPYWHTTGDTADKVSPESLERVGRVLEEMVRRKVGIGK